MIPVSLRLKGIYSYIDEQRIDFGPLAASGLFGIFGPVGSGKSTILEAITFAIYGETERLNQREDRKYNMMNLKSDSLLVDLICKAGRADDILYRFTVSGKRTGKDFNKINTYDRGCYRQNGPGGEWAPAEEKPEAIIGLSYENFRRTIIIPQGRFSDFLHLGGTERNAALMEIFQLEKYDLDDKAKNLYDRNRTRLESVQTLLLQLEDVSAEQLTACKQELALLEAELAEGETQLAQKKKEEQQMQELQKLHGRQQQAQLSLDALQAQHADWQQRRQRLRLYRQAQLQFAHLLADRQARQQALATQQAALQQLQSDILAQEATLAQQQEAFARTEARHARRDEYKETARQMRQAAQALELDTEVATLAARIQNGHQKLEAKIAEQQQAEKDIAQADKDMAHIRKHMPNHSLLTRLNDWYTRHETRAQAAKDAQEVEAHCREEIAALQQKQQAALKQAGLQDLITEAGPEKDPLLLLQARLGKLLAQEKECEQRREHALREQGLEQHLALLQDGEPCPLCGSQRHPAPRQPGDSARLVQELNTEREQHNRQKQQTEQAMQELRLQAAALQREQGQLATLQERCRKRSQELEAQLKLWEWQAPYSPQDDSELRQQFARLEADTLQLQKLEEGLIPMRQKLEKMQREREHYTQVLNALSNKKAEYEGQLNHLLKEIGQAQYPALKGQGTEALLAHAHDTEVLIEATAARYRQQEAELASLKQSLAREQGQLGQLGRHIAQLHDELKALEQKLEAQLAESEFDNWEAVLALLAPGMDAPAEEEAISAWQQQLHAAREALATLATQLAGRGYVQEQHTAMLAQLQTMQAAVSALHEAGGGLKNKIGETEKRLAEKTALLQQAEALQSREDNIRSIRKLMQAKGFVNYVSRIYLDSLCQSANARFRKLTRNRLELEMDENNQFLVRDYLNEGRLRHIKTLSGGQTFQAALSLALALADNTQKLASRSQNFFFLDEGFGSLDRESLGVVMETLKFLRSENRIVGVISHVEELQQEMEVYLNISLDANGGSRITPSWEGE